MKHEPDWLGYIDNDAGKRFVLLVEGPGDIVILSHFLDKHHLDWDVQLFIAPAGGKPKVIQGLKHRPQWIGVVDRDEWSQDEAGEVQKQTPRLKVLPRFCIESYFCVPGELWGALPPVDRRKVNDDASRLSKPLLDVLPDWVAHGAMWRVLRVRARGVRSRDVFPHALQESPITDEDEIRRVLETWQGYLDPESILHEYRAERKRGLALPVDEQLTRYVVGDKFFVQVVTPALDELFGASDKNWLERLRDGQIQPPPDLAAFFNEILGLI
jgi:hypothetical protein